jgi:hypothetical protein
LDRGEISVIDDLLDKKEAVCGHANMYATDFSRL